MAKTPLIIAGMHRSGTSLTASLLQSAGVNLGSKLMQAKEGNPKGYFENLDFYKFHQEILRSQSLNIDGWSLKDIGEIDNEFLEKAKKLIAENSTNDVWGWKDPRNTLFLDFWANLLPEAKFLLIYRSPWEVVDSLYRRGDKIFETEPHLAIKSWIYYNQKIINFINQYPDRYLLTNITTIINNSHLYIDKINQVFALKLSYPHDNIYEPKLLGTNISQSYISFIDLYFPEAIEIYQELECRALTFGTEQHFSWQQSTEISNHSVEIFQSWQSLRKNEARNYFLEREVKEFNHKLKETETVLEKSQEQLKKTESVLQNSHKRLKDSQTELENKKQEYENLFNDLEIAKKQLTQAQWDFMRYQSQLHSTQEELEQSELQKQELEANVEKLKQELEELQPVLNRLFNQVEQGDNNQNKLQFQLYEMQRIAEELGTSAKAKESLEIELKQLQNQVNEQQIILSQLMNKLEDKEINQEKLKFQLRHLEAELESQMLLKK